MSKYQTQLHFAIRYEKIASNYAKKSIFYDNDVINDVTGWPERCLLYSCLGEVGSGVSCKGNISSINASIVNVFPGYTYLKKISINKTFQGRMWKIMVTGLLGELGTYTAITPSIMGVSRWNKNWNVRNNHSYVAMATKIWFHFRFPRSYENAFNGHIGWL